MGTIVLTGATSGSTTIQPTDAVTVTATFPPATGTVMVSGNMPAFSVYSSVQVAVANTTFTKVTYDTKDFDTNSNFASSRFTPTIAGYYQFNVTCTAGANTAVGQAMVTFYKNGARFLDGQFESVSATGTTYKTACGIIYFNGSTDYVEVYNYQNTGLAMNMGGNGSTLKFTGCMVRSA